jgi:hypothetical protein
MMVVGRLSRTLDMATWAYWTRLPWVLSLAQGALVMEGVLWASFGAGIETCLRCLMCPGHVSAL